MDHECECCSCLSLAAPNLVEYYAVDDLEDASEATLRALPRRERRSIKDPVMLKLVLDEQHGQGHGHGGKAALLIAERSPAWPWSQVGLVWFVIKIEVACLAGRLPTNPRRKSTGEGRHVGEAAAGWAGIVDVTGNACGTVATLTTPLGDRHDATSRGEIALKTLFCFLGRMMR